MQFGDLFRKASGRFFVREMFICSEMETGPWKELHPETIALQAKHLHHQRETQKILWFLWLISEQIS